MKRALACVVVVAALAVSLRCFSGYSDTIPAGELRVRRGDFVHDIVRGSTTREDAVKCVHCHRGVGHGARP